MSNDTPPPPGATPETGGGPWRWRGFLRLAGLILFGVVAAKIASLPALNPPAAKPEAKDPCNGNSDEDKAKASAAPENPRSFGYVKLSSGDVGKTMQREGLQEWKDTDAGKARLGALPDEVYLWKAVERCWGDYPEKDSRPYPCENQSPVGCCVGWAGKHEADVVQAIEVLAAGGAADWVPLSPEATYAMGRIDIGRNQLQGHDGSNGSWEAAAALKYGFAPMIVVGKYDLRKASPSRARTWGNSSVPAEVLTAAAQHKFAGSARITSWDQAKESLAQGYPIMLCSDVGYDGSSKDRDGFMRRGGEWPHCMALLGYQKGANRREGGLILNNWGPGAHPGPRGAGDPPSGWSFWAESANIDAALKEGDSFALSKFAKFPARKPHDLDWIIRGGKRYNSNDLVLSLQLLTRK